MEDQEEYIKPSDIAKLLKVSRPTIYKWIKEGRMRGVRFGDDVLRVPRSSFDAFMRNANEATAAREKSGARERGPIGGEDAENQKPTSAAA